MNSARIIKRAVGLVVVVAAFGLVALPAGVKAEETQTNPNREEVKTRVQGRLSEARKKMCETRGEVITKIVNRSGEQAQKHLDTFTKIATRVKEFYVNKGLSVANYDELVAAVDSKKAAAEAAIAAAKQGVTLDCSGENPIGRVEEFKTTTRAVHIALKDYRTAIKNLLVAVKTAAGQANEREQ